MATRARKAPARKSATKSKGGRPTKFKGEYLTQVTKLCLLGLTDAEIAKVWGVAESTYHLWKQSVPGFSEAIAQGRQIADADVAVSLYERAKGYSHPDVVITSYQGEITKTRITRHYPPDTHAASIWLRNRRTVSWRSQPEPIDGNDEAPAPQRFVIEVKDARKRPADAEPQQAAG